jgi:hypothetical protein
MVVAEELFLHKTSHHFTSQMMMLTSFGIEMQQI